jgi:hypothetical protein
MVGGGVEDKIGDGRLEREKGRGDGGWWVADDE